jgi:endonuclease YncB( thermonuclease family)
MRDLLWLLPLVTVLACGPVGDDDDDASNDDDASDYDPSILPQGSDPARTPINATVDSIIDGDTMEITRPGSPNERVRFLAIDTPELNTTEPWGPECWADDARDRTRELLPSGTPVWLTFDGEIRDDFGRLLSYIFVGAAPDPEGFEQSINWQLVREGHARTFFFPNNQTFRDTLEAAERAAQDEDLGLWSCN